jgi:anti-anti-sigma factor
MARPPESLLRVSMVDDGGRALLRVEGELDCATAPELEAVIARLWSGRIPTRVVVDAADLTFVDVAGIRPLLDLRRRLPPGGVQVRNARRQVVRVLRLLDVAGDLGIDG